MLIRRVTGNSMLPGLVPGSVVVAWKRAMHAGDIVIARQAAREVVKRVENIKGDRVYLRGDNSLESSDSREFGPVKKEDILGVVMIKLPVAVDPPKVRTNYTLLAGWIAAGIMTLSALLHLFRIDTLLPLLDNALPGGYTTATLVGALVMVAEVFAVPFLLRMRLSPLMHAVSGFNAMLVPLFWLLVTIWGLGHNISTAQFGEFLSTPSTIPLLMLDIAWLGYNTWVLWLLGYGDIRWDSKRTRQR